VAAAPADQVRVTNCTSAQYKPRTLVITCGDAGILLQKLRWTSWTRTRASGSGVEAVNDCNPDCAAGHLHRTLPRSRCRGRSRVGGRGTGCSTC